MKILVRLPVNDRQREMLRKCAGDEEIVFDPQGAGEDAEVILGNIPAPMLAGCRKLRWLQLDSAGADNYIKPGAMPDGAYLTNATGAYGLAISEHMLGCLLMLMKRLNLYWDNQKTHFWHDEGHVRSIFCSTALVVGLGDIGGEFARRLHDLGATVYGIRRRPKDTPDYLSGLYAPDALMSLLPKCDIVAACMPGTKDTAGMFGRAQFEAMKPGTYFLNIGRGSAVDALALRDALVSGRLAGASVDVTDPEPLPKEHPLWDAPNLLLTPHISGQFHLAETFERIVGIACDNLTRYRRGEPLRNIVDPQTGYCR